MVSLAIQLLTGENTDGSHGMPFSGIIMKITDMVLWAIPQGKKY